MNKRTNARAKIVIKKFHQCRNGSEHRNDVKNKIKNRRAFREKMKKTLKKTSNKTFVRFHRCANETIRPRKNAHTQKFDQNKKCADNSNKNRNDKIRQFFSKTTNFRNRINGVPLRSLQSNNKTCYHVLSFEQHQKTFV